jgi:hypothetical protein
MHLRDRGYLMHHCLAARPPCAGARWIVPRQDGERFYAGYWETDHGRIEHDHRWDSDHDRDFRQGDPRTHL